MPFLHDRRILNPETLNSVGASSTSVSLSVGVYEEIYSTVAKNLAQFPASGTTLSTLEDHDVDQVFSMIPISPEAVAIIYQDGGDNLEYVACRGKDGAGVINAARQALTADIPSASQNIVSVGAGLYPYVIFASTTGIVLLKYNVGSSDVDVLEDDTQANVFSSDYGADTINSSNHGVIRWITDDVAVLISIDGTQDLNITTIQCSGSGIAVLGTDTAASFTASNYNKAIRVDWNETEGALVVAVVDSAFDLVCVTLSISADYTTVTINDSTKARSTVALIATPEGNGDFTNIHNFGDYSYTVVASQATNILISNSFTYDPDTPAVDSRQNESIAGLGAAVNSYHLATATTLSAVNYSYRATAEFSCHQGQKYGFMIAMRDTNQTDQDFLVYENGSMNLIAGTQQTYFRQNTTSDQHGAAAFTTDLSKLLVSFGSATGSVLATTLFELDNAVTELPDSNLKLQITS